MLAFSKPGISADDLFLHVGGQRGADAVAVNFVGVQAFGLEEDVVAGLVGKAHDFVLDAGAIARAGGSDLAAVHRGAMEIGADDLVNGGVGVR